MNEEPELVENGEDDEDREPESWRHVYLDRRSLLIAALFVGVTALTFLVSRGFAVLFLIPVALSLASVGGSRGRVDRLKATGEVMVFNGIVLMVALLIVGFIRDFLLVSPEVLDTAVGFAYTTVHVMLGLGLFFHDYRTLEGSGKPAG